MKVAVLGAILFAAIGLAAPAEEGSSLNVLEARIDLVKGKCGGSPLRCTDDGVDCGTDCVAGQKAGDDCHCHHTHERRPPTPPTKDPLKMGPTIKKGDPIDWKDPKDKKGDKSGKKN